MSRILITLVLAFTTFDLSAQVMQDVVYLKNGSVLKGKLIQNDSLVKVEILGGSMFAFSKGEVLSIESESFKPLDLKGPVTPQANGWFGEFSFGIPFGVDQWGWPTAGITLNGLLGYQFKPLLKTGIGTGIDWYGYESTMMPFYARITGDFFEKKITPFYVADLGYGANISQTWANDESHFGGLLMHLGGGFKFNTRRSVFYNFSIGYKTQFASSHYFQTWLEEPYWEYRQFNRIECRLAIGF